MGSTQGVMDAKGVHDLAWDHVQLRELPVLEEDGDADDESLQKPRPVRGACFSRAKPTPVARPQLVLAVEDALALIDLPPDAPARRVACFCGNEVPRGARPSAHCYAGYQFGEFAGALGDGAAISLGEVVNGRGERWEVQLKGAGRTPFARTGDGRAVLRSSLREFVASEAMHALGVPTTYKVYK